MSLQLQPLSPLLLLPLPLPPLLQCVLLFPSQRLPASPSTRPVIEHMRLTECIMPTTQVELL
jgi:hypothetical protein